ncbi:MAG: hypothetical protein WAQ28_12960 [Bacteroidia bacterium]
MRYKIVSGSSMPLIFKCDFTEDHKRIAQMTEFLKLKMDMEKLIKEKGSQKTDEI